MRGECSYIEVNSACEAESGASGTEAHSSATTKKVNDRGFVHQSVRLRGKKGAHGQAPLLMTILLSNTIFTKIRILSQIRNYVIQHRTGECAIGGGTAKADAAVSPRPPSIRKFSQTRFPNFASNLVNAVDL